MKLSVLHLSDIHFKSTADSVFNLSEKIATAIFSIARDSDACLLAVTGDIAFSGHENEYKIAKEFLENISKTLADETKKPVYIICVPGNHDCVLKPVNKVREILIANIIENPMLAVEDAIIAQCVVAQENYFKFRKELAAPELIFDSPQWSEYGFNLNGSSIKISALNAAWMSQLKEEAGKLVFPLERFELQLNTPSDLRLVLLHQPYNWHQQRSYHDMKTRLRKSAVAVLNGHEHVGNSGVVQEELTGSSLYFEASALNPHEEGMEAGFASYQFDTSNRRVAVQQYTIVESVISEANESVVYEIPSASEKNSSVIELKKDWLDTLDNPGGYFTHTDKLEIVLDDIFIYPDLRDWEHAELGRIVAQSSLKVIEDIKAGNGYVLLGEEKSGKTTLLFHYVKQLIADGYVPVYVNASELNNIRKSDDVGLRIDRFIEAQYVNHKAVARLPKTKRIILIDDIDRFKSGTKFIPELIEYVEKHFLSAVITANAAFEISSLANIKATEALNKYKKFEIQRFGKKLRHKLIKKWCNLGNLTSLAELDKRIDTAENTINLVIGKNLVPQLPFYLLILLQSCDQNQSREIQNSGFSHYYQFLITQSLGRGGVTPLELNEYDNYLAHLAWYFQRKNVKELNVEDFRLFNDEFSKTFTTVDLLSRCELLVKARILFQRGNCYGFAYPYIYYFFMGKYLAKTLNEDAAIKAWVIEACSKLYQRDNANTILFLTHHDSSTWVIQQILAVMRGCFCDKAPIEFNGDTAQINTLITTASQLVLAAPNIEHNQEKLREYQDEVNAAEENFPDPKPNQDGELDFLAKATLLVKTAEIAGQILKNYYGSLAKPLKAELLQEVFNGPLRLLSLQLDEISGDMNGFVAYLDNLMRKDERLFDKDRREMYAGKFAFNFLRWVGTSIIASTSYFVASDKLREDIARLVKNNSTVAYRLIDIGTRLVRPGNLPLEDIGKLAKELEDNHYPFAILQYLGASHLYQFHTSKGEKDQLCSILKISEKDMKTIELQGRDTKLIS
ncbi:metallophosphoesterase [Undibacterium sp.]|uniref:STAND family AAA ATPase n=1 Tax=Undibacterium sp. TaxID=1914977 RepID=UPI0025FBFEAE|nr:metallophosphoesterase [Undibacterium sp.]